MTLKRFIAMTKIKLMI